MTSDRLQLSQTAEYLIVIQGRICRPISSLFEGFTETVDPSQGTTILHGPVADQAALHGVLTRIRDLGLPLLKVTYVPNRQS